MQDFFEGKYSSLPRPNSWMPGPTSHWAHLDPKDRTLDLEKVISSLEKRIQTQDSLAAFVDSSKDPFPEDETLFQKPSAVLVPFITTDGRTIDSVILTTRTMTVNSHKGEVSFPGGRVEERDGDAISAALRETKEEVNLDPDLFKILGTSSLTQTRSRLSSITPVIGLINADKLSALSPSNEEVEQIHIVEISQLVAPDAYSSEVWDFGEISPTIHIYRVFDSIGQPVFIWGATAHILTDVLHCLVNN